jgi:glutamyl-tRNA reductase
MRNMKHLSPADAAAVEALTKQILSKVLHRPTVGIKQLASESSEAGVLRTMRNVFGLGDPDSADNGQ